MFKKRSQLLEIGAFTIYWASFFSYCFYLFLITISFVYPVWVLDPALKTFNLQKDKNMRKGNKLLMQQRPLLDNYMTSTVENCLWDKINKPACGLNLCQLRLALVYATANLRYFYDLVCRGHVKTQNCQCSVVVTCYVITSMCVVKDDPFSCSFFVQGMCSVATTEYNERNKQHDTKKWQQRNKII